MKKNFSSSRNMDMDPDMQEKKKKDKKSGPPPEPPEHSIPLRVVSLVMIMLTITASCLFSKVNLAIFGLYVSAAFCGCIMSYVFREQESNKMMKVISYIGILGVGYLSIKGFLRPLSTEFDFVVPFVIFLAGVFSFICFEMRTRSDINLTSVFGLILLCVIAPVAKGVVFGGVVLAYITLGAVMLYFDCVGRTLNAWLARPINKAQEVTYTAAKVKRGRNIPTIGFVGIVPILAVLLFLFMPRIDAVVDDFMASTKSLNPDYMIETVMPKRPPARRADDRQSAREWFKKNNKMVANLGKKKNIDAMKEQFSKLPKNDKPVIQAKRPPDDSEAKNESEVVPDKNKKDKKFKDKPKSKTERHPEDGSAIEKENHPDTKPPKGKGASPPSKAGGSKSEKKSESKAEKKSKSKKGKKAKKSKRKKSSKAEKKAGKQAKNNESTGNPKASAPGSHAGAGHALSDSGDGGKGGKGAGAGKGEGAGSGSGSGSGGGGGPGAGKFVVTDEGSLDLRHSYGQPPDAPILEIKSRRLVYLRRQCFDKFNGVVWKASENKDVKTVKVVDGEVKKKKKVIQFVPQKQLVKEQPKQVLTKSSLLAKGGGSTKDFKKDLVVNTAPQPQKVVVKEEPKEPLRNIESKLSKSSPFDFKSSGGSMFRVGDADALSIPIRYPSINLTQEIEIKADSIGSLVPTGWVPQEVILKSAHMNVDKFGVIKNEKPLKKGDTYKVKSELPIFNTSYMRQITPMSAQREEVVRDNFAKYLQLPATISDDIFELAERNTSPEFNWFVQSEQIAEYLRKNYTYTGVDKFPQEVDDYVYEFLFKTGSGENIHFASAFVILNRCIGIPARLVTGFSPGTLDKTTGVRKVKGADAHAWAEVYVPNMGWVPFDPTPEGYLPAQQRETTYTAVDISKDLGLDEEEQRKKIIEILDHILWTIAAVFTLFALFLFGRKLVKRIITFWKNRIIRGPEWSAYKKVVKAVRKGTDIQRRPQDTPSEYVDRVQEALRISFASGTKVPAGLAENLEKFMHLYTLIYFGGQREHMEDLKYYADMIVESVKQAKKENKEYAESARRG